MMPVLAPCSNSASVATEEIAAHTGNAGAAECRPTGFRITSRGEGIMTTSLPDEETLCRMVMARIVVDATIDATARQLVKHETIGVTKLKRALNVSIAIGDRAIC